MSFDSDSFDSGSFSSDAFDFGSVAVVSNILELWRGAVEPASTTPSGNEYQAWKGAVEPAAPTIIEINATSQALGLTAYPVSLGFTLNVSTDALSLTERAASIAYGFGVSTSALSLVTYPVQIIAGAARKHRVNVERKRTYFLVE